MIESQDQRNEQPTPRRRRQVRLHGYVARSGHLVGAVVLLGASTGLTVLGGTMALQLLEILEQQLRVPTTLETRPELMTQHVVSLLGTALGVVLLPLAALFLLATVANLVQVGLLVAPAAIRPQWSRLSPSRTWGRTFSGTNLAGSALTLLKAAAVMVIAAVMLEQELPVLSRLSRLGPQQIAAYAGTSMTSFALKLSVALCVIAVLDYAVQHWRHVKALRMTRAQVREDQRELEGDPLLRQRRRAAHGSQIYRGRDASHL